MKFYLFTDFTFDPNPVCALDEFNHPHAEILT